MKKATFFGMLWYQVYHRPKGVLLQLFKTGLYCSLLIAFGKSEMKKEAFQIPFPTQRENPDFQIVFLTGKDYLYQTLFCIASLMRVTKKHLGFTLYDDGTLTKRENDFITALPFSCTLVPAHDIEQRLDLLLPRAEYPSLRARRDSYPHIRKVIDVHIGSSGWQLVFDSDMLFFKEPQEIFRWLESPTQPLHLVDVLTSYGYSKQLLEQLTGYQLQERVNVGVTGLESGSIDWKLLESWCKEMIEKEGTHYTHEQALVAMLVSSGESLALKSDSYIVRPDKSEVRKPQAILHHYVAESKQWYYRYGWRAIKDALIGIS